MVGSILRGLGFRLSKYYFDYSRSSYHISGIPNGTGIATNLSTFDYNELYHLT